MMVEQRAPNCPFSDRPWHLDSTDLHFVRCCPAAQHAADTWLCPERIAELAEVVNRWGTWPWWCRWLDALCRVTR